MNNILSKIVYYSRLNIFNLDNWIRLKQNQGVLDNMSMKKPLICGKIYKEL